MKFTKLENPFAVVFVIVEWAGEPYEVDFFEMLVLCRLNLLKFVVFANGVTMGDLGAKIAPNLWQQHFLGVIFWLFWEWGNPGPQVRDGFPGKLLINRPSGRYKSPEGLTSDRDRSSRNFSWLDGIGFGWDWVDWTRLGSIPLDPDLVQSNPIVPILSDTIQSKLFDAIYSGTNQSNACIPIYSILSNPTRDHPTQRTLSFEGISSIPIQFHP